MKRPSFFTPFAPLLAALLAFAFTVSTADAQPVAGVGTVRGIVVAGDGTAVKAAVVTLRGKNDEHRALTDAAGRFAIPDLAVGLYAIRIASPGYDTLSNVTVGVRPAAESVLTLSLTRTASSLITIGRVAANANALGTSSAPTTTIDAQTYAERGFTRISDVLQDDPSTTLVHVGGGGSSALPTSVALRGPDPTETLVDIDGHQVNNGNTGDFDFSLLDPADYGTIELVKGISPSSLVGPDTIDGAINIRTLEPTVTPHGLARFSVGSFDAFGETLESTGTYDRLGYALSLHRTTTAGEVNGTVFDIANGSAPAHVGSGLDASTALGKVRYTFGRVGDGYAELSFHDQTQDRDLSAALTTIATPVSPSASGDALARRGALDDAPPLVDGFEGTTLLAHDVAYGLDLRVPLGSPDRSGISRTSALLRHYTSIVGQSVEGPGADTSPYLYNDRDRVDDDTVEIDRSFEHASLTFQYDVRTERLATDFLSGVVNDESVARGRVGPLALATPLDVATGSAASQLGLGQTQRSAVLRYAYDLSASLHLTAAGYYSRYSIFGTSIDPRFGAVFTPDARSVVRFTAGTTYQAPQLPELFVPAVLPVVVGNVISVGNPNLRPDRATEYEIGLEHLFDTGRHRTDLTLELYRVNLRAPSTTLQPAFDPTCGPVTAGGDGTACPLSYPVNAGDGVYQGIELGGERRIGPFASVRAGYAVRSAYLTNVPPNVQDGTLVVGEQSLGLPLQKATLQIANAPPAGLTTFASLVYEGDYNELNQPPYATLNAGIGYRFRSFELSVSGTNLTNVYDRRFTSPGAGVTYGGLGVTIATDAYALQGTAFNVSLTRRF